MKNSIILATAVAAILTSGVATADLSANAGIFSNYIWRGVTQTGDAAAGQGGIDWGNDSGAYAGTWVSTLGGALGYEMDVYAGFAGEAGDIGYDIGVITYQYPVVPHGNFTEVYVSGSISAFTAGIAATVDAASGNDGGPFDEGDIYINGSFDYTVGKSDVSIYLGSYMFDNDGAAPLLGGPVQDLDYVHFGASLSKDGFTFAVDKNDISGTTATAEDNVRFTVSYSMDFEL